MEDPLTTLLLLASLALAAPEMIPEEDVDVVGRTAPDIEARLFDDTGTFKLSDLRGKTVVLSFWASWCGPCRFELPALDALSKERSDVVFYAINVDRERSEAMKFLKRVAFDLPIVWDNDSIALGSYQVLSMPTMFVIDDKGTVKFKKVGFSQEKGLSELIAVLDGMKR